MIPAIQSLLKPKTPAPIEDPNRRYKIDYVIGRLILTAHELPYHMVIETKFNRTRVLVDDTSDQSLILRDWERAQCGFKDKAGPHPLKRIPSDILGMEERVIAESRANALGGNTPKERIQELRIEYLQKSLEGAPETYTCTNDAQNMSMLPKEALDQYSLLMSNWARLMEKEIAETDRPIASIAMKTFHIANTDALDEDGLRDAAYLLSRVWIHGEELGEWISEGRVYDESQTENETINSK
jgi:hypothetical protein